MLTSRETHVRHLTRELNGVICFLRSVTGRGVQIFSSFSDSSAQLAQLRIAFECHLPPSSF